MLIRELSRGAVLRSVVALSVLTGVVVGGLLSPVPSLHGSMSEAEVRSLSPAQKKAKAKALAKCKKIKSSAKRKQCVRKVNLKFRADPKPGNTWQVGVWDNYYSPDRLAIKANDMVNWTWNEPNGREAHDVSLLKGPSGVKSLDFTSPTTAVPGTKFKRQFKVPGTYDLICSLHHQMTMQVKVTR